MNFIWYRNTHRFIPENNRPEDLWVFFVYIRFLVMQVFEEISFQFFLWENSLMISRVTFTAASIPSTVMCS